MGATAQANLESQLEMFAGTEVYSLKLSHRLRTFYAEDYVCVDHERF